MYPEHHNSDYYYEHVYFANAGRKQTEDIKATEKKHACKTKYEIEEKRAKCITETICTTDKNATHNNYYR